MSYANLNRIVILEPQELFIDYLVKTLEADGLQVVGAAPKMEDADLAAFQPNTVLVDVGVLSDASAFATLGRVRKTVPQARLVVFGGNSSPAWRAGAWAQNVNALLTENDGPAALIAAAKAS
jgi:DNA-binding NarL/FixJ family response regulator